jgi:hypothetical protein
MAHLHLYGKDVFALSRHAGKFCAEYIPVVFYALFLSINQVTVSALNSYRKAALIYSYLRHMMRERWRFPVL